MSSNIASRFQRLGVVGDLFPRPSARAFDCRAFGACLAVLALLSIAVLVMAEPEGVGVTKELEVAMGSEPSVATAEEIEEPIAAMLGVFGLTRETARPDAGSVLLRSRRTLASPISLRVLLDPLDAPYVAGHLAAQYRRWSFSIVRTVLNVVAQTPAEISRGYLGNPLSDVDEQLIKSDDPLLAGAEALYRLAEPEPQELDGDARKTWENASGKLPANWRLEIGRLLLAAADATEWQRKAFESLDPKHRVFLERASAEGFTAEDDLRPVIEQVDWEYLYAGALDLAVATEDFEDFVNGNPAGFEGEFDLETPLGRVVLHGDSENNELDPDPRQHALLVIDLGGDDLYGKGITQGGMAFPVQMVFDLNGNDYYVSDSQYGPSWGGAVTGYGVLVDRAGNDTYRGGLCSQGAGILGAGFLIDRAGNDSYAAFAFCQGCGYAGIGILHDAGGDDRYEALTRAQGCGDSLGSGTLLEESGSDVYILNDEIIQAPSPQTAEHNASMGQGTGVGYRADLADGHSLPGGVGVLYDLAGNDRYSAGVFAQGCGYLGGSGFLMDDAGSDTLKAAYYAQGAAAHRGVGVLINRGGNDSYDVEIQCAQGCGHDLGVGWLLDTGGDDRYRAYRLAQGAANENGWGLCVDLSGSDSYAQAASAASADSLGASKLSKWGTMREDMPALGLFLDAGGRDAYPGAQAARNDHRWTWDRRFPGEEFQSERGIGWDGEFPRVDLRSGPLTPFPEREFEEYAAQQALRRRYREARKD